MASLALTSPTLVAGGLDFAEVRAGRRYSCGVTTAGDAYCWGSNNNSAVGDGIGTERLSPALVLFP